MSQDLRIIIQNQLRTNIDTTSITESMNLLNENIKKLKIGFTLPEETKQNIIKIQHSLTAIQQNLKAQFKDIDDTLLTFGSIMANALSATKTVTINNNLKLLNELAKITNNKGIIEEAERVTNTVIDETESNEVLDQAVSTNELISLLTLQYQKEATAASVRQANAAELGVNIQKAMLIVSIIIPFIIWLLTYIQTENSETNQDVTQVIINNYYNNQQTNNYYNNTEED